MTPRDATWLAELIVDGRWGEIAALARRSLPAGSSTGRRSRRCSPVCHGRRL